MSPHRDARRYRAMDAGYRAREKGLPKEARPARIGEPDWWVAGWHWRDDQVEVQRLRAEVQRLRIEAQDLRGRLNQDAFRAEVDGTGAQTP